MSMWNRVDIIGNPRLHRARLGICGFAARQGTLPAAMTSRHLYCWPNGYRLGVGPRKKALLSGSPLLVRLIETCPSLPICSSRAEDSRRSVRSSPWFATNLCPLAFSRPMMKAVSGFPSRLNSTV